MIEIGRDDADEHSSLSRQLYTIDGIIGRQMVNEYSILDGLYDFRYPFALL